GQGHSEVRGPDSNPDRVHMDIAVGSNGIGGPRYSQATRQRAGVVLSRWQLLLPSPPEDVRLSVPVVVPYRGDLPAEVGHRPDVAGRLDGSSVHQPDGVLSCGGVAPDDVGLSVSI